MGHTNKLNVTRYGISLLAKNERLSVYEVLGFLHMQAFSEFVTTRLFLIS